MKHTGPWPGTRHRGERIWRRGKAWYQGLLDIKGGYETVERTILWRKRAGMETIFRQEKRRFDDDKVIVGEGGGQSREIDMGEGVHQRTIQSANVIKVYIKELPMTQRTRHRGGNNRGLKIKSLQYGDEKELETRSLQQHQRRMHTWERHSRDHRYKIGREK